MAVYTVHSNVIMCRNVNTIYGMAYGIVHAFTSGHTWQKFWSSCENELKVAVASKIGVFAISQHRQ